MRGLSYECRAEKRNQVCDLIPVRPNKRRLTSVRHLAYIKLIQSRWRRDGKYLGCEIPVIKSSADPIFRHPRKLIVSTPIKEILCKIIL